jgi:hypothetical protein
MKRGESPRALQTLPPLFRRAAQRKGGMTHRGCAMYFLNLRFFPGEPTAHDCAPLAQPAA